MGVVKNKLLKRSLIAKGREPDPSPLCLDDGTIIFVPRTQLKGVYSRFKTHNLVIREPGVLEFRAAKTAKAFSLLLFLSAIALIIFTLVANLPVSFIFGGVLLLVVSILSSMTWVGAILISIDKQSGTLSMQNYTLFMQDRHFIIYLSDIAAVQVLAVELGDAIDVTVTTYEVNLVYAMPAGERTWLLSFSNFKQAKQAAVQLGEIINCPVLEHAAF